MVDNETGKSAPSKYAVFAHQARTLLWAAISELFPAICTMKVCCAVRVGNNLIRICEQAMTCSSCIALRRVRTSSGMFLNRAEDDVIERIEARIAKYTAIPKENGEGLQVLHYQVLDAFCLFFLCG